MKIQIFCLALLLIGGCVSVSAQTTNDAGVVAAVAPVYPVIANTVQASGDVTVDVKIDASGKVTSARAVDGHPLLQSVSVSAARRWKFVPAQESNTQRTARLTFTFLQTKDVPEDERTAVFLPPYKIQITGPRVVMSPNTVR